MKDFKIRFGKKGFTIYEAMVAVFVMSVGLVGLMTVVRRGVVADVKAWDKMIKTNIALSRIEEHKAQIYTNLVPGLQMGVVVPAITYGATPQINFNTGKLNYSANTMLSIDGTTNTITNQSGYGVSFATPSISPTNYYGVVVASPTPTMEWIDVNNRSACDQTNGDINFTITTPPGVNGTMALWFVDALNTKREQTVWMNGLQRAAYTAGSMSTNFAAPSTVSFAVNNYDTASGLLQFDIKQSGSANNWGDFFEDGGSNASGMTIFANVNTPTFTPTPVTCNLNQCNQLGPGSFSVSGNFQKNRFNTYIYAGGNSGTATASVSISCAGKYMIYAQAQSGSTRRGGTCNNELLCAITGSSVTLLNGGVTATWWMDPSVCGFSGSQTVQAGGGNFAGSAPATWQINTTGTYTIKLYCTNNNSNNYPRVDWICISQIATLATPTFTPVFTYTPTATPAAAFTFPTNPTPMAMNPPSAQASPFINGATNWQVNGCDPNKNALVFKGKADATGILHVNSQQLSPGVVFDTSGYAYANVRLMGGMSVTMKTVSSSGTTVSFNSGTVGTAGWYQLQSPSAYSAGTTLTYVLFDFAGASSAVTNYLAIDSVRIQYPSPLNPNSVLMGANLSILNSYVDYSNFAPYVVNSYLLPMTVAGSANGYQIAAIVHNGRISKYVTPTPGATPANSAPVPLVTVTDQFPPVTIINTISQ